MVNSKAVWAYSVRSLVKNLKTKIKEPFKKHVSESVSICLFIFRCKISRAPKELRTPPILRLQPWGREASRQTSDSRQAWCSMASSPPSTSPSWVHSWVWTWEEATFPTTPLLPLGASLQPLRLLAPCMKTRVKTPPRYDLCLILPLHCEEGTLISSPWDTSVGSIYLVNEAWGYKLNSATRLPMTLVTSLYVLSVYLHITQRLCLLLKCVACIVNKAE